MAEINEVINEEMTEVETVDTEKVSLPDKAAYVGGLLACGYVVYRLGKFVANKVVVPKFKKQEIEVVDEVYDDDEEA